MNIKYLLFSSNIIGGNGHTLYGVKKMALLFHLK